MYHHVLHIPEHSIQNALTYPMHILNEERIGTYGSRFHIGFVPYHEIIKN